MTNNVFNTVQSGPWFGELVGATVTVCYNTITNSYGSTGFFDAYNSKLTVCGNQISKVIDFAGIIRMQSVYKSGTLPSTVYITDNQILHQLWMLQPAESGGLLGDHKQFLHIPHRVAEHDPLLGGGAAGVSSKVALGWSVAIPLLGPTRACGCTTPTAYT